MTPAKNATYPAVQRLIRIATDICPFVKPPADLDSPDWENVTKRFSWGYYVDDGIRSIWKLLSIDAKLVAYIDAITLLAKDDLDF